MTAVAAPGTSAGSGGRGRAYVAIGVVVALVVAVVVLALIAPSRRNDGAPLDPSSTSATGTKAAVELARRLGADVSSHLGAPRLGHRGGGAVRGPHRRGPGRRRDGLGLCRAHARRRRPVLDPDAAGRDRRRRPVRRARSPSTGAGATPSTPPGSPSCAGSRVDRVATARFEVPTPGETSCFTDAGRRRGRGGGDRVRTADLGRHRPCLHQRAARPGRQRRAVRRPRRARAGHPARRPRRRRRRHRPPALGRRATSPSRPACPSGSCSCSSPSSSTASTGPAASASPSPRTRRS